MVGMANQFQKKIESLKELGEVDTALIGKIAAPVILNSVQDLQDTETLRPSSGRASSYDSSLKLQALGYKLHDSVATRQAYGDALVELGKQDEDVVVLDAEMSNSTLHKKPLKKPLRIAF